MRKFFIPALVLAIAGVLAVFSTPYMGIANVPEIAHTTPALSMLETYCSSNEELAAKTGSNEVAIECSMAQSAQALGNVADCQQELHAVSTFVADHNPSANTPDWVYDQACQPTKTIVIRDARPTPRITGRPQPTYPYIVTNFSYQAKLILFPSTRIAPYM